MVLVKMRSSVQSIASADDVASQKRRDCPISFALACSLWVLALLISGGAAAHPLAYSKFEATSSERDIVIVFGLDTGAVLELIERDVTHEKAGTGQIEGHRSWFSRYLFERFWVKNDGLACTAAPELLRFFYDSPTNRVVAATKYACPTDLGDVAFHSTLTPEMPTPHELVGDFQYSKASERRFLSAEETDVHVLVHAMRQAELAAPSGAVSERARSWAGQHNRLRQYDDIATAILSGRAGTAAVAESPSDTSLPGGGTTRFSVLLHFTRTGIHHIFTGYDHLLFILTLMLAVRTWRNLAIIVTSFTIAHSITLVVATLGWVKVSPGFVEPLIAGSVLYVAADALARPHASARAAVTFAFGLVHGFGFSGVLRSIGLGERELVPALVGFNAGVELGQLLLVIPVFPLILWLREKEPTYTRLRSALCVLVVLLATSWIVLRIRGALIG
jgi:hydrogenase/urease accessory protein HupE